MAHDELASGLALQCSVKHLDVGAADGSDLHLQNNFARSGLGDRSPLHSHIVGAMQDHRVHAIGDRHKSCLLRPSNWLSRVRGAIIISGT